MVMDWPISSGPARSVRTDVTKFERAGGASVEKPWYHSTVYYDGRGRATEQVSHNPNGTVTHAVYRYNGVGKLMETTTELDGIASGRTVHLYDAAGRLSYELSLRADGSEGQQTRRFYEPDGSYTEEFTVDRQARVSPAAVEESHAAATQRADFIRTRRDPAGRPLEMRFYDAGGGLLYRFVYHYNAIGRLTDMEQRTGDTPLFELPPGEPMSGLQREFAALFSPDAALSTVRYRYDEQGRRTEAATWMGAHCVDRRTFAYNERGDRAGEKRYGPDGSLKSEHAYEREYDEHGNWIRETLRVREGESGKLELSGASTRTIEYAK